MFANSQLFKSVQGHLSEACLPEKKSYEFNKFLLNTEMREESPSKLI